MKMDNIFHYPPDLMNLLINTIPRINKSKKDVFLFFQGAGVPPILMQTPFEQWNQNKGSIDKYEITRQILTKINESGDGYLRERREVLKRVAEFEAFSSCWPNDQLIAKGLVAEIRNVVNVKDSFTRMANERELEKKDNLARKHAEIEKVHKKKEDIEKLKSELFSLFSEKDKQKRGKKLESVLNSLFFAYGILIREAFTLTGDDGEGIKEQIDGVIEVDSHLYFVEMKWWDSPIGVPEVSQHLIRVYHRAESRAIIISASNFTSPAVSTCKDSLQNKVVVLCTLQEIVLLLEREGDLLELLRTKVNAAVIDRKPYLEVLI